MKIGESIMELKLKIHKKPKRSTCSFTYHWTHNLQPFQLLFLLTKAANDNAWILVTDGRGIKAYPDLREYVWQKNASLPPNGTFDKIGFAQTCYRPGITPKGVIFINPGAWGSGEQLISNPPDSNFTANENFVPTNLLG